MFCSQSPGHVFPIRVFILSLEITEPLSLPGSEPAQPPPQGSRAPQKASGLHSHTHTHLLLTAPPPKEITSFSPNSPLQLDFQQILSPAG